VSWVQSPSLHLSTKHQAAVLGSKRKRVTGLSHPTTSLTTEFFDSIGQKRPKDDVRTESGLPPTADIEPQDRHVPFVPISLQKSAIIRGGS